MDKVKMIDIEDNMLGNLKSADFEGFIKLGMEFSDAVIVAGENKKLETLFKKNKEKKVETFDNDENSTESYFNLYNELVG
jgi:starch synthase